MWGKMYPKCTNKQKIIRKTAYSYKNVLNKQI